MTPNDPASTAAWPEPPISDDELCFDDGEPMESTRHRSQMDMLVDTLESHVEERGDVWVAGNAAFHFSPLHIRNRDFRAPDVMVVVGVERRERKGWVPWHESSKLPDVIIELLSESTRDEDLGPKLRTYEWLGIPVYVTFDPFSHELTVRRLSFRKKYVAVAPGPDGRYPVEPLGLCVGLNPENYQGTDLLRLRWFTPEGSILPTGKELAAEERARAEGARERAEEARERAEEARARADEERAQREALESRLAEALARLATLEAPHQP